MHLSKRVEYGVVASVHLARRSVDGTDYVQSREIARSEELPAKFLESILLALKSAGILESKVGAGGGYRLVRRPDALPVLELVEALETRSADSETPSDPGIGRRGLVELTARIDGAMADAVGDLSLADLVRMAGDEHHPSAEPMYSA